VRFQLATPFALPYLSFLLSACAAGDPPRPHALTDRDRAAIRAVDTAFVQGWLRDDTTAILALFHSDAVLLPPSAEAVEGLAAIRAYWWPTDGSHTSITSFTREIVEIGGTSELAYFRGPAALGWVYRKSGKEMAQTSQSTDLVLLTPDGRGRWRILRQMWSPRP
jgi:uncharacterized protein (TIGR02246 family)